ncbi:MAG: cytochrome c [Gammaproteobacteria bacterium]|nr:cytochrome c [Gammaproteobacteria bacterium]
MPVSINALMVTLIDHSAHHIWDYEALERDLSEEEWRIVEYFGIQLAAAGPLLTLGGSGPLDDTWAGSEQWTNYSQALSNAAMLAMDAARNKSKDLLTSAGDALLTTCLGCHGAFKPETPTEGIMHNPEYDHLYHLFEKDTAAD